MTGRPKAVNHEPCGKTECETLQAKLEVSRVLSDLGIAHTSSLPLVEGLLSVDIAIPAGKTALMLPPASHFCVNMATQPLGSTTLEWRLLASQEWKVLPFNSTC